MWVFGGPRKSAKFQEASSLRLEDVYNHLAEGSAILLDARGVGEGGEASVKDACRIGTWLTAGKEEEAVQLLQSAIDRSKYGSRCALIVFGSQVGDEAQLKAIEWIRGKEWIVGREDPKLYLLQAPVHSLLHSFSFLCAGARGVDFSASSRRLGLGNQTLPHQILDDLFLGDYDAARNPVLHEMGIHAIVNASGGFDNAFEKHASGAFRYHVVNVYDSPDSDIQEYFESTLRFVDEARRDGKKILIHCAAGISRSTTLTLVVLMTRHGMSLRDAFLHTKKIRSIVCPNSGFVQKLLKYEESLRGATSVSIPALAPSYLTLQNLIMEDLKAGGMLDEETIKVLSY